MRVALVHDWLTGMRGGEKVLLALARLFPDAPILTLLHVKGALQSLEVLGQRYRYRNEEAAAEGLARSSSRVGT